jgi:hypothetical protein
LHERYNNLIARAHTFFLKIKLQPFFFSSSAISQTYPTREKKRKNSQQESSIRIIFLVAGLGMLLHVDMAKTEIGKKATI